MIAEFDWPLLFVQSPICIDHALLPVEALLIQSPADAVPGQNNIDRKVAITLSVAAVQR